MPSVRDILRQCAHRQRIRRAHRHRRHRQRHEADDDPHDAKAPPASAVGIRPRQQWIRRGQHDRKYHRRDRDDHFQRRVEPQRPLPIASFGDTSTDRRARRETAHERGEHRARRARRMTKL
jgi:hypothetical protein